MDRREAPNGLTAQQLTTYRSEGFLFPLPVMPSVEAAALLGKLEALERREGGRLTPETNQKPHLLLTWLNDLVRHPRILDVVEAVIGPDILCWDSGFFAKNAHDPARVTWHQDSTYWGLSKLDVVSAWVAFTPSTVESGAMRVIPRTHLREQLPHRDTFARDNLLSRGQEVAVEIDLGSAVDIVLQPGEMSLHHVRLVHGSEPNRADHRRVGFVINYISTAVEQITGLPDSASLVRGHDRFGHFIPEPRPGRDFDPEAVAFHAGVLERSNKILYRGAAQQQARGRDSVERH